MKKKIKITIYIVISIIVFLVVFNKIWFSDIPESFFKKSNNKDVELHVIHWFNLYGYADSKGNLKIRTKFYDAKEFSEGLAVAGGVSGDGYIDKSGKMVIKTKYDLLKDFHDGVAIVGYGEHEVRPYQYGLIDKNGKEILHPKYRHMNDFSEELALVEDTNYKYGYIDKNGNEVIKTIFDKAIDFKNGIADVMIDGKKEKIDKNGAIVDDLK